MALMCLHVQFQVMVMRSRVRFHTHDICKASSGVENGIIMFTRAFLKRN